MIKVFSCYSKLTLDVSDFTKVMKGLNEAGSNSVIWQSKVKLLETAGINILSKEILDWIGYYNVKNTQPYIYRSDIIVDGNSLIYITTETSGHSYSERNLEIGVIADSSLDLKKILVRYVSKFDAALKKNLDGRKYRHMKQSWFVFPNNDQLDTHVTFYKSFTYPIMNDTEVHAVKILFNQKVRQLLRRIAEHESFKASQIREDQGNTLNELIRSELVTPRYVISCKKNSSAIAVVQSKAELEKNVFNCPHCGRNFCEENIQENFVLSDLGRRMTDGSHWMTILLTRSLIDIGVPQESIIWNLTEDSEEVDCVVQFKDKTWIFELKDRDFEPGDAHPLTYRAIKFKASKTIIFTTGKVTAKARKVFQDMLYHGRGGKGIENPLFIEGIESINSSLQTLVNNATLLHVKEKAKHLSLSAGIDFSPIFYHLFGKYRLEHKGEFVEDVNIFKY